MARAIWTGSISFGLVTIPVGLFSATEDHTIHFHQFERGTGDRIRNHRVNERTGAQVDYSDIVKGTEVGDGEYVQVETDELDSVAPGRSRSLELTDFVALDEIDPIYLNRTYWLAPTNEQYAKPYRLLRDAMERTGRAGIGRFVMRGKEYLVAIRPDRQVLALETLFFADEVRDPAEELDNLPGQHTNSGKELDMATQLVESMASAWRPSDYRDTYRDRVAQLIEDKHQGREVVAESDPAPGTEMSELIDALERSVSSARSKKSKKSKRSQSGPESESGSGSRSGSNGRRAGGQRRPADLAEASKTELTKMARELRVAGRSSMTADELAEAIDRARKDAPKARRAS